MRPVLQPAPVVDIPDNDYRWDVKQVVASVALPVSVGIHPVVVLVADSVEVAHPAVAVVVEAAPADSVEADPQASAVVDPADIDTVSFEKVRLDFENCPTRACPAVVEVAELALWDHIDYDIDLAWSILFCIHAINNNEAI
mgnify:CR=1 FL=1